MARRFTLITGASAGIGKEMAIVCAKKKFNLLLVALQDSNLPEFSEELKKDYGVEVFYLEADLSEQNAPEQIFNWCIENNFQVDKLINNVAAGGREKFETQTLSSIQFMIDLNIYAASALTNLFLPLLKNQPKAHILNISSLAYCLNIPQRIMYAATKAYIYSFTMSLRSELKRSNISVSASCPGGSIHKVDEHVNKNFSRRFTNFIHQSPALIARDSINGMLAGKRIILPGFISKFCVAASWLLPTRFVDAMVRKVFKPNAKVECSVNKKEAVEVLIG